MNKMKQALSALIIAVCLALAATPVIRAVSAPQILQQKWDFRNRQLTVYVRHADVTAVSGVSVGRTKIESATVAENPSETSVVTWILLDNSADMPDTIRPNVSDFLLTLLNEKAARETYNFCTFSDRLSVKLRNSGSFDELKKRVEEVEYNGRQSDLTGALDEVFAEEAKREGTEFVRILVISAGGGGTDFDSLRKRLSARESTVSNIPVYAIGCNNGSNGGKLSEMYALSTNTYARSWDMDKIGASDIASIMRWEEIPVRISMTIPERLWGGMLKELIVSFADGTSAHTMAFITGVTEDAETDTGIANGVTEGAAVAPTQENALFVGVVILLVLLAGAGAAFFIIRRRPDGIVIPDVIRRLLHFDGTEHPFSAEKAARIDDNGNLTLYLKDAGDPERQFHAPLRGRVTIGRGADNVIVLSGDRAVSRAHCQIYLQNNELWIQDSNSSGGTFLGDCRIVNRAKLANGAAIRLGHASYQVEVR